MLSLRKMGQHVCFHFLVFVSLLLVAVRRNKVCLFIYEQISSHNSERKCKSFMYTQHLKLFHLSKLPCKQNGTCLTGIPHLVQASNVNYQSGLIAKNPAHTPHKNFATVNASLVLTAISTSTDVNTNKRECKNT